MLGRPVALMAYGDADDFHSRLEKQWVCAQASGDGLETPSKTCNSNESRKDWDVTI